MTRTKSNLANRMPSERSPAAMLPTTLPRPAFRPSLAHGERSVAAERERMRRVQNSNHSPVRALGAPVDNAETLIDAF